MQPFNKLPTPSHLPKEVLMPSQVWEPLPSLTYRVHAPGQKKRGKNLRAKVPRVWNPETTVLSSGGSDTQTHRKKVRSLAFLNNSPKWCLQLALVNRGVMQRLQNVWKRKHSLFRLPSQSVLQSTLMSLMSGRTLCGKSEPQPQLSTGRQQQSSRQGNVHMKPVLL